MAGSDPFDVLGLPARFDLDEKEIESRYRELSRVLHPDRHVGKPPAERRLILGKAMEVNEAARVLRDPVARASALLGRRGVSPATQKGEAKADPEFLMWMMEVREALSEARSRRDAARVGRLAFEVRGREAEVLRALSAGLADGESDPHALAALIGRLRYFRRFLDEVSSIEDELLASGGGTSGSIDASGSAGC